MASTNVSANTSGFPVIGKVLRGTNASGLRHRR